MKSRNWVMAYVLLFLLLMGANFLRNYVVDRYGIFRADYSAFRAVPNQNFIKMSFLLNQAHSFDSFIFGSSRVGTIDPCLFKNGNYYNMTYSEGVPWDHLSNIKLLIDSGVKIKNLFIALDELSYQVEPQTHLSQPLRHPHYLSDNSEKNSVEFYYYYLSRVPTFIDTLRSIKRTISGEKAALFSYDIANTGLPVVPKEVDDYIDNNKVAHSQDKRFSSHVGYRGNRIQETLEEIKQIIALAKEHGISYTMIINPSYQINYLDTDFKNFQDFKRGLSQLTDFYDFSGLNSVTTEPFYFYDSSHYRGVVGAMIAKRLVGELQGVPDDFGVLVTSDTVEAHLRDLSEQIHSQ